MFSTAMKETTATRVAVRTVSKKGPNDFDKAVGERVRAARNMRGISQEKLAQSLDPPLTFQQVQKYERGTNRIGASRMQQISEILQQPVSYFFGQAKSAHAIDLGARALATPHGVKLITAFLRISDNEHRALLASLADSMVRKEAKSS